MPAFAGPASSERANLPSVDLPSDGFEARKAALPARTADSGACPFRTHTMSPADVSGVEKTGENHARRARLLFRPSPGSDPGHGRKGLRSDGFRATAATRGGLARHLPRAVVAQVGGLGAAACVGKGDAQRRALVFADFLTAIVADENGSPGQCPTLLRRNDPATSLETITQRRATTEFATSGAASTWPVPPRSGPHRARRRHANGARGNPRSSSRRDTGRPRRG